MSIRHEDLYEALGIIYDLVSEENINWHLNGSFNLLVQGLEIEVHDLDIETDEAGLLVFREKLKEFLLEDEYNKDIEAHSLVLNISGVEVEILAHDNPEIAMISESKVKNIEEMNIPVLDFEDSKKFYKMVGNEDKVKLIDEHLSILSSFDV